MKLSLGTAQFGSHYGISNSVGKPDSEELKLILQTARHAGINHLDTAPAYGSEENLGGVLGQDIFFNVTTKTPYDMIDLEKSVEKSLMALKTKSVYGLLIHDANVVFKPEGVDLWRKMRDFKGQGKVKKIGVSVYTEEQINGALSLGDVGIIQLPINLLDQRLIKSGALERLKSQGVEIHARSVFLQGLLFLEPKNLNRYFRPVGTHLDKIRTFLSQKGMTILEAALGFSMGLNEIDRVIVGVNTANELSEIISATKKADRLADQIQELARFSSYADEAILNPSLWPKT